MHRVLYIHHVSQLGGASTSLLNLIKSFPKHSVEPLVLCPPGSAQDAFQAADIPVVSCPGVSTFSSSAGIPFRGRELLKLLRSLRMLHSGKQIKRVITEFRPDLVHL